MSALAAARRDAVSSPAAARRLLRSISSAAERALVLFFRLRRCASPAPAPAPGAAARLPLSGAPLFLPAAPLRLRVLVRLLLFIDLARKGIEAREKVRRGRARPDGLRGRWPSLVPNADAANDTLPRTRCARSAAPHARLDSACAQVALRRRLVAGAGRCALYGRLTSRRRAASA